MTIVDLFAASFGPRAFSSLWFYALQVLVFGFVILNPLGIPHWVVTQSRTNDAVAQILLDILRSRKSLFLSKDYSPIFMFIISFFGVAMLLFAFWYRVEWAQAILLIIVPAALIFETQRNALQSETEVSSLDEAHGLLGRFRRYALFISICAILVTQMVGFLRNWSFLFG